MKITHIYPFIHRQGGIERYLVGLVHEQSKVHEITLLANQVAWRDLPKDRAIKWIKTPCLRRPSFLSSISFCLANVFTGWRNGSDISNAQGASAFFCDVVTAHSVHLAWFIISIRSLVPNSKAWWLKILNPMHYFTIAIETIQYRLGGCKLVIAISQTVKNELMHFHKISPDRIQVVYSGVDSSMFHPSLRKAHFAERQRRFGWGADDFILIFIGNEFRRKGLSVVLNAMALAKNVRIKLLVVGSADSRPFIQESYRLGLGSQVFFCGRSNEIPMLLAISDAFVFPTVYEPFGLVITEAMACGLPVVTSRCAGAAELIEDGKEGLLLSDPNDPVVLAKHIAYLLESPEARQALGMAARLKAEMYSVEECARQTESVYRRLL